MVSHPHHNTVVNKRHILVLIPKEAMGPTKKRMLVKLYFSTMSSFIIVKACGVLCCSQTMSNNRLCRQIHYNSSINIARPRWVVVHPWQGRAHAKAAQKNVWPFTPLNNYCRKPWCRNLFDIDGHVGVYRRTRIWTYVCTCPLLGRDQQNNRAQYAKRCKKESMVLLRNLQEHSWSC